MARGRAAVLGDLAPAAAPCGTRAPAKSDVKSERMAKRATNQASNREAEGHRLESCWARHGFQSRPGLAGLTLRGLASPRE
ncbi:MAG: hypothetical protein CFK52_10200 [Chloracidobacterium sp. CP2_5A]|nr:MAG: hypothetical protein CFK52_10200 [Chloracidobacterium sp. CP2_5A]